MQAVAHRGVLSRSHREGSCESISAVLGHSSDWFTGMSVDWRCGLPDSSTGGEVGSIASSRRSLCVQKCHTCVHDGMISFRVDHML